MAFADLQWEQGAQNMGGLVGSIYFCPIEDIDFTTPPTVEADLMEVSGNIICISTKRFYEVYFTKGTGKADDTVVGERDGRSKENMVEFFYPGGDKDVAVFERDAMNTPMCVIYKDSDGNLRLLGLSVNNAGNLNTDLPAYLETGDGTTGAASADRRGKTFSFKAEAAHAPLFYSGTVQLTPTA